MDTTALTNNRPVISLGILLMVTLLVLAWTHQSGQQLLKNSTLLVDKVMQLRVDLTQTHYMIHEGTEESRSSLDSAFINMLVGNINKSADFLHGESVQMGRLSGAVSDHYMSEASINDLKESLEALSSYLEENYTILNRNAQEDLVHDQLFASAEMLAEEIDEQVHEGVAISLEQQRNIFMVLFGASFFSFAGLLFLLRRSNHMQFRALQQATKLSQALEHSGEAAIIANKDGVIEFVNDAFCHMTGYSAEETLGNNPNMLSSGKQEPTFYESLWSTISSGMVWQGELINRRKDGTLYPALMTIAPIVDAAGEITHYVANQSDVSEYKRLEESFYKAQKLEALGTLAGGIAHDFNNALAGITGNIYLLDKGEANLGKDSRRNITAIEEICDSAATHIRQILSYARQDTVLMDSIELNQCLQKACLMASSMIPASIQFEFIPCENELYVYWNESQVQQILINLLNNAQHALKGVMNPKITLKVQIFNSKDSLLRLRPEVEEERHVCLSVTDNGCGMPKEIADRIFDPFFTTRPVDEGTGLGLSMAYGAIKQAGGSLIVDSEVGRGTEFRIYLPLDFERQEEVKAVDDEVIQGHGELILIADDDSVLLQTQGRIVESFGYRSIIANDGLEAVHLFEKHVDEIDVVILDLVMPGLTGVDTAKQILSLKPETRIIFATGYDKHDTLESNVGSIDAPVIYKPCKSSVLSQVIHDQLKK